MELNRQNRRHRMGERKSFGTVSYTPGKMDNSTPSIKVSGNWLKEQGFMVGDKLNILVKDGELRIWKEKDASGKWKFLQRKLDIDLVNDSK